MSKKGRPPPPPKPEELIEILERKFEEFKVEMLESLQSKSSEILKLEEADTELKSSTEGQFTEIKDILESLKEENAGKLVEMKETQEVQCQEMKKGFEMLLLENMEELKQDLGLIILFRFKIASKTSQYNPWLVCHQSLP